MLSCPGRSALASIEELEAAVPSGTLAARLEEGPEAAAFSVSVGGAAGGQDLDDCVARVLIAAASGQAPAALDALDSGEAPLHRAVHAGREEPDSRAFPPCERQDLVHALLLVRADASVLDRFAIFVFIFDALALCLQFVADFNFIDADLSWGTPVTNADPLLPQIAPLFFPEDAVCLNEFACAGRHDARPIDICHHGFDGPSARPQAPLFQLACSAGLHRLADAWPDGRACRSGHAVEHPGDLGIPRLAHLSKQRGGRLAALWGAIWPPARPRTRWGTASEGAPLTLGPRARLGQGRCRAACAAAPRVRGLVSDPCDFEGDVAAKLTQMRGRAAELARGHAPDERASLAAVGFKLPSRFATVHPVMGQTQVQRTTPADMAEALQQPCGKVFKINEIDEAQLGMWLEDDVDRRVLRRTFSDIFGEGGASRFAEFGQNFNGSVVFFIPKGPSVRTAQDELYSALDKVRRLGVADADNRLLANAARLVIEDAVDDIFCSTQSGCLPGRSMPCSFMGVDRGMTEHGLASAESVAMSFDIEGWAKYFGFILGTRADEDSRLAPLAKMVGRAATRGALGPGIFYACQAFRTFVASVIALVVALGPLLGAPATAETETCRCGVMRRIPRWDGLRPQDLPAMLSEMLYFSYAFAQVIRALMLPAELSVAVAATVCKLHWPVVMAVLLSPPRRNSSMRFCS
ncbi:unnamed protein product [Prorocentrum cordatum]|uniref:Uncharacterized protein n=1 Tax=Prorocentrum cordatum TaxID=2364126 RepID=A0ABN9W490_9DINO|nr:unnamed protein product [Polarella glacialis]